jgi:hypothetical protein
MDKYRLTRVGRALKGYWAGPARVDHLFSAAALHSGRAHRIKLGRMRRIVQPLMRAAGGGNTFRQWRLRSNGSTEHANRLGGTKLLDNAYPDQSLDIAR